MSPTLSQIRVRKSKTNPDKWEVVGGGEIIVTISHARAKEIAGARRRVLLKHALRKVGVHRLPKSLIKDTKRGL